MTCATTSARASSGRPSTAPARVVLLIDEIDKADIEFPNDLLQELDRMEFHVYETGETVTALHRPVVIITSNNEKELPDAFLRRCFFHYIRFPDPETLAAIVRMHFPGIKEALLATALTQFFEVRETPGLKKKPSTSEVLDWLKLILAEDLAPEDLRRDGKGRAAAVARRALEERTGRAAVRAAGLPGARAALAGGPSRCRLARIEPRPNRAALPKFGHSLAAIHSRNTTFQTQTVILREVTGEDLVPRATETSSDGSGTIAKIPRN